MEEAGNRVRVAGCALHRFLRFGAIQVTRRRRPKEESIRLAPLQCRSGQIEHAVKCGPEGRFLVEVQAQVGHHQRWKRAVSILLEPRERDISIGRTLALAPGNRNTSVGAERLVVLHPAQPQVGTDSSAPDASIDAKSCKLAWAGAADVCLWARVVTPTCELPDALDELQLG